jgi:hypothetical protein
MVPTDPAVTPVDTPAEPYPTLPQVSTPGATSAGPRATDEDDDEESASGAAAAQATAGLTATATAVLPSRLPTTGGGPGPDAPLVWALLGLGFLGLAVGLALRRSPHPAGPEDGVRPPRSE